MLTRLLVHRPGVYFALTYEIVLSVVLLPTRGRIAIGPGVYFALAFEIVRSVYIALAQGHRYRHRLLPSPSVIGLHDFLDELGQMHIAILLGIVESP